MSRQEAGRRGGQAVAEKYGSEHYRRIGQKGRRGGQDNRSDEE
jgi:hypothetical protein